MRMVVQLVDDWADKMVVHLAAMRETMMVECSVAQMVDTLELLKVERRAEW